jgi:hypothetical protein
MNWSDMKEFNRKLGTGITNVVGTMWCAYAFAAIALISLPSAIASHNLLTIVSWVAQTFLQLVLLSIIMVGQAVSGEAVEKKITETHTASLAEFELAKEARKAAASEMAELKAIAAAVHAKVHE